MRKNTMSKVALIIGILCIVLAVIVFVFADGLRYDHRDGDAGERAALAARH